MSDDDAAQEYNVVLARALKRMMRNRKASKGVRLSVEELEYLMATFLDVNADEFVAEVARAESPR